LRSALPLDSVLAADAGKYRYGKVFRNLTETAHA
jgi:hypothetical protein